jgi:hypothetical protein
MLLVLLCLMVVTPPGDPGDVLSGLSPELDGFHTVFAKPESESHFTEATLRRDDLGSLRISVSRHASASEREEKMRRLESGMARSSDLLPGSPSHRSIHSSLTGMPLGDLLYRFGAPAGGTVSYHAGAGRVTVTLHFSYNTDALTGTVRWQVGDAEADGVLVENLVRRLLGRSLALDRISRPELEAAASAGRATDNAGRVYVPVFAWAGERQGSPERQGTTMVQFAHQGRTIQALTGANKISIDGSWVPLGDTVMEIAGEPYVLREALENALR